mmetsp:Transcript_142191/g.345563  ORF Transcript_142191/g.345563 Transcript_142191/m.345563 type:complete len:204 (+) Transcript_142191:636-1247(+)
MMHKKLRSRRRGILCGIEETVRAGVVSSHAKQAGRNGESAAMTCKGQVDDPSATKAVTDGSKLHGVHKLVAAQLGERTHDLAHVEPSILQVRAGRSTPGAKIAFAAPRTHNVVAVDVSGKGHVAHGCQEVRAVHLVLVHAVPILHDEHSRALVGRRAYGAVISKVASGVHILHCVIDVTCQDWRRGGAWLARSIVPSEDLRKK